MKRLGSLALVLVLALSVVTLAGAQKVVRIGISLDNLDDPFWQGIKVGFDKAQKELGNKVNVTLQVAQTDANVQNKQIQDMVTAGVDAIVCVYVDKDAIMQSVKLCNEKGIPFVYCDRPIDATADAKADWGITTDHDALTRRGWDWMVQFARDNHLKLKVCQLMGSLTEKNTLLFTGGYEDAVKANPNVLQKVVDVPTEWNLEKALAGTTNALQAYPEINCIYLNSDFLLAPTIQALKGAGKWKKIGEPGHIIVVPYSGNAVSIKAMQDGYIEVCFGKHVIMEGHDSVIAAYNLAIGKKKGYDHPVADPGFIITQKNLNQTKLETYGYYFLK